MQKVFNGNERERKKKERKERMKGKEGKEKRKEEREEERREEERREEGRREGERKRGRKERKREKGRLEGRQANREIKTKRFPKSWHIQIKANGSMIREHLDAHKEKGILWALTRRQAGRPRFRGGERWREAV